MSETERIRTRKALHDFLTFQIKEGFNGTESYNQGWRFVEKSGCQECDIDTFAESTADDVMAALAELCR